MDLEKLNVEKLLDLQKQVDDMLVVKKREARAEVRKEIRALAAKNGTSVEELFGVMSGGKRSRGKAPAKYANPDDPNQTWTGRGRQPRWLQEAVGRGAAKEDFLIA